MAMSITLADAIAELEHERNGLDQAITVLEAIGRRLEAKRRPAPAPKQLAAPKKNGKRPAAKASSGRWVEARAWYEGGQLSESEIARKLGVSGNAVAYHRKREGWKAPGAATRQRCPSCGRHGVEDPCEHCRAVRP